MPSQSMHERLFYSLFIVVSTGLNLPALVVGVMGSRPWCDYFSGWLASNAGLAAANMLAAIYAVYRLLQSPVPDETRRKPVGSQGQQDHHKSTKKGGERDETPDASKDDESAVDENSGEQNTAHDSIASRRCCKIFQHTPISDRIRRLIRYDKLMSTYCVSFLFWIFWLSDGVERSEDIDRADPELLQRCSADHEDHVQLSFILGYIYVVCLLLSVVATFLSSIV